MTETEPLTRGIVIFGATGDLCKKKLIPALHKLWEKDLLPKGFTITGAARRDPGVKAWKESLGDYPEEFMHLLDYCLLYTSPSPRDLSTSRMPSSA